MFKAKCPGVFVYEALVSVGNSKTCTHLKKGEKYSHGVWSAITVYYYFSIFEFSVLVFSIFEMLQKFLTFHLLLTQDICLVSK